MRLMTCSIPEPEKKVLAYCECCKKPLYIGDKIIKDDVEDYYCKIECLSQDYSDIRESIMEYSIKTITLEE